MDSTFFLISRVVILSSAVLLGHFLSLAMIALSPRIGFLDYPTGRKIHPKPMPNLGGAAVFLSFWIVVMSGFLLAGFFAKSASGTLPAITNALANMLLFWPKVFGIFLGSLVIFGIGLLDDRLHFSPSKKLAGQILAALILMSLGFKINLVEGLGFLGFVVTFVWILLMINAFNFIDSLDGHCAGIALIACILLFWLTQIIGQLFTGILLLAFAGALLGFFRHNFKPARIFLGDNGSLMIGYMMAAFTLICRYQSEETVYATIFIPILMFGVPIYDTVSVVVVRLRRGTAPWKGDRNHFAHRLVKIGMSQKIAVTFSYFIEITLGLLAILTTQVTFTGAVLIGFIFLFMIAVIAFLEYYASERSRLSEELASSKRRRKEDLQKAEEERFL